MSYCSYKGLHSSKIVPTWLTEIDSFEGNGLDKNRILSIIDLVISVFREQFDIEYLNSIHLTISHRMPSENAPSPFAEICRNPFEFKIFVNYHPGCWDRLVYQLSHELSHALMRCYPRINEFKWIAEVLCEVASLFVLNKMNAKWRKHANLKNITLGTTSLCYAQAFSNYLLLLKKGTPSIASLSDFYKEQAISFATDPNGNVDGRRPRNEAMAWIIFDEIDKSPDGWQAITSLDDSDFGEPHNITEFLKYWYNNCTKSAHKNFVRKFAELIGVYNFNTI